MSQDPDPTSDRSSDPAAEGGRPRTAQEQTGDTAEASADVADHSRDTEVSESDPNADSAEGLAGGMGVSSERTGAARGESDEVTYGAGATHHPTPVADVLPEQSADPAAGEEVTPEQPVLKEHPGPDTKGRGDVAYGG